MATPQPMPAGGQRPPPAAPQGGPVPHQNLVLQHGHPQPALVPMMSNAPHYMPQGANAGMQIPLQHAPRPQLLNGAFPPGTQPGFAIPQGANPAQHVASRQAEQLRHLQHQQGVRANPALGQQIAFQPQMQHVPNPQQLQQMQQLHPNQQVRMTSQGQVIPGQHLIQHSVNPNGAVPHVAGPPPQMHLVHL